MSRHFDSIGCGRQTHFNRRTLLKAAGLAGASWLTPLAERLARAAEIAPAGAQAKSVIVLWLQGGPSQFETFDPHPDPDSLMAGGTKWIKTAVPEIRVAEGLERVAEQMESISLVRSVTSKEGDHERATYNAKTGFRPDPTLVHPSIGAVVCHQLPDNLEIPRHVTILPGQWPARGGYLGDQFDAFQTGDPLGRVPDVTARVPQPRFQRRLADLENVVEAEFARGRLRSLEDQKTLHLQTIAAARKMMDSEQLTAFDVEQAPQALRDEFGDTAFGRGCLAAMRLIEVGVRCVEVTLNGWDSHVNNHETQRARVDELDPAFAALVKNLRERDLLDQTVVVCGGEFGRTPRINPAGGRDHWPHGFTMALAGGGIGGGRVIGETTTEMPDDKEKDPAKLVRDPHNIADVHATILHTLGIDFAQELDTPVGRPMAISKGSVIKELLV